MASKYFNTPATKNNPKMVDAPPAPTLGALGTLTPEQVKRMAARPKIFIGIPCHDSRFHSNFAMSIFDLVASNKYELALTKTSSGGITKARNDLVYRFLKGNWDYLLFADTDIQFNHHHLDQLLARNKDIVGGMYCHKKLDLAWSANHLKDAVPVENLQEVAGLGFGFILIKRIVFTTMMEKMPELRFKETWSDGRGEWKYGFFQEQIVWDKEAGRIDPEWYTEDWFFTHNARKLGFKIYCDNNFYLQHHEGGSNYPMDQMFPVVDALMDYAEGRWDEGKKAKETMQKALPGWLNGMKKNP